jgi:hypothetical protein
VRPCIFQKKDHEFSREGSLIVVVEGGDVPLVVATGGGAEHVEPVLIFVYEA